MPYRADTSEATDWVGIAETYEQLARLTGSPVVEVNRALSVWRPAQKLD